LAAEPVIFKGQELALKGDKDRFVLPAKIRKLVTQSSDGRNELLVTLHADLPCLVGFGESHHLRMASLIRQRADEAFLKGEAFNPDDHNTIFGDAIEVGYDSSGRMIIPAYLRKTAGITDAIFFYGFGDTFLMWSPEQLMQQQGRQWTLARAACEALLETSGKGRK